MAFLGTGTTAVEEGKEGTKGKKTKCYRFSSGTLTCDMSPDPRGKFHGHGLGNLKELCALLQALPRTGRWSTVIPAFVCHCPR